MTKRLRPSRSLFYSYLQAYNVIEGFKTPQRKYSRISFGVNYLAYRTNKRLYLAIKYLILHAMDREFNPTLQNKVSINSTNPEYLLYHYSLITSMKLPMAQDTQEIITREKNRRASVIFGELG